jgi:hypothetical protein
VVVVVWWWWWRQPGQLPSRESRDLFWKVTDRRDLEKDQSPARMLDDADCLRRCALLLGNEEWIASLEKLLDGDVDGVLQ